MTVYNGLPYLEESIRSILTQEFEDYEFLIIDDASTDGSVEMLQDWEKKDSRIRPVLNKTNSGQTRCLNQGISLAEGEWIARQDADDLSLPTRLARQMERVHQKPELSLLGTNGWLMDSKGKFSGLLNVPTGASGILWSLPFLNPFIHSSVCFRREKALALGGYDERLRITQDYNFWVRFCEESSTDNIQERLVCYRVHAASLSVEGSETKRLEADESCRLALRVCGLESFDDADSQAILSEFREGRTGSGSKFWKLHQKMKEKILNRNSRDFDVSSMCRTDALLHWKAAGAAGGAGQVCAEVASAFWNSPELVIRYLCDRLTGMK